MPKSDNSSTLNTLGTLGALGVLGAGGYAGYRHYKKKQQEERKKAAIRNAILGATGGTAAAGGAAYGGLKYLQGRNAKDLENLSNLAVLSNIDNNIDKLDDISKQYISTAFSPSAAQSSTNLDDMLKRPLMGSTYAPDTKFKLDIPLGYEPMAPNTKINTAGLHPKTPTKEPTFKTMGTNVKPERVRTGTVSYIASRGRSPFPNPVGSNLSGIQFSSDPKIRVKQMEAFIDNYRANTDHKGREFYDELGNPNSEENKKIRRYKKQQRAKRPEVQARREARKAKEQAHNKRMAEQSRLHKLESQRLVSGNKVTKTLIAAGVPPSEAIRLTVAAKTPSFWGDLSSEQGVAEKLLNIKKPHKLRGRTKGISGAKVRQRARIRNLNKAGKKVLSALT